MKKIRRFSVGSSLLVASATMLCSFTSAQASCQNQPIGALQETVSGTAFVCSNKEGVKAQVKVNGLTPGNAYTVWFIYVDNEAKCVADGQAVCFGVNDPNGVPDATFGRLGNVIAPSSGKALVSGAVAGLQLSTGSQVTLLVKGHGALNTSDNLVRARQLLTPEDSTVGAPNLGIIGGPVADFAGSAIFNY